ncbi:type IV secretory system conjugative DNA transfer family protein [Variovorax ginsengisoli]|uniref:Type IV secretion system protein VirD4 n=1 Tax=Variovorax ginsengisoli TaxID=363844 RepID=A0ABT9SES1_9BURK|nr:type IV secretory system conjugative DNA transfer family protein [Variovorax ginsengisoli]MDP9902389.1 type IV secretion system protein VirD4 [Variovorax ginsengisoli]
MSKGKVLGLVVLGFISLVTCLAAANYLAGVILFLSFKEDPSMADFSTLHQAWSTASSQYENTKVKASTGVALLICLGIPGLIFHGMMRGKRFALHGKARFANATDIAKEQLDGPTGIILGKHDDGRLLRLPGYEFTLVAAPTRTGKGVSFCVPNLLTFEGSAVVLDIKGENYNLTSQFRAQYLGNSVFYFNPFSETTCRWNPLSYVSKDPNFRVNDLMALAVIIYPTNPKDPFWPNSARNVFIGLALLVLETPSLPKTLGEVLRQGSGKGQEISDYLHHVMSVRASSDMPLSTPCTDALNRFLNNPDNTLKNILSSFVAPLSMWGSAVIDKATSADDFDLRDVRKMKMSIYTHIPANEIVQAGFILNLFFSQLINENTRELPEHNPDLKYQVLMLMDECTAAGKIEILAKGVGYMAGYNMRLAIVIQDRTQLESVYGKPDAKNILSNMGAKVFYTPSDIADAKEYSALIGTDTVQSNSTQRSNVGAFTPGNTSMNETESPHARPLMLPQEVLAMDKRRELIVRSGIPIINAEKIIYYADPFFYERFTAVPMQEVVINGEKRAVPVPYKLPRKNWRVFHQALARSDYYMQDDFSDLSPTLMEMEESSLLDQINSNASTMDEAQLDALCSALSQRKIQEFAERFSLGS